MGYCEAVLREGMRIDTLVPLAVAHRVMEDTKLDQYQLSKVNSYLGYRNAGYNDSFFQDAFAFANLAQMHHDTEVWGDDAEVFRPERFLVDGKLCLKNDKSLPFGLGRRVCAGETFARNTMFLYLTAIMQNYKLESMPGNKLPDLINGRRTGLVMTINDLWVKLTPR